MGTHFSGSRQSAQRDLRLPLRVSVPFQLQVGARAGLPHHRSRHRLRGRKHALRRLQVVQDVPDPVLPSTGKSFGE